MMKYRRFILLFSAFLALVAVSCSKSDPDTKPVDNWIARPEGFQERYALEEMVVLSRHNIRSPLSGNGSVLSRITSHEWFEWTSKPSELSVKGAQLEVLMGRFFKQWLVREDLLDASKAKDGEMRIYANSLQRTIATAEYFLDGFYPDGDFPVEYHMDLGKMDPVFNPSTVGVDDSFRELALQEMAAMGGSDGFTGIGRKMDANFTVLENVLDMKDAPAAVNDTVAFNRDDVQLFINEGAEPSMKGGLKMATSAADALVLQYYEETDDLKAGFGHKLSFSDWEKIAAIKDWYEDVLFTCPSVAANVSALMLEEIRSELMAGGRKFSFLCGHDSNLCSVLAALNCKEFDLKDAIEKKTPVGGKLVFEKWLGADGNSYVDIVLVYASAQQLRRKTALSLSTPPSFIPIEINGLSANKDGLYRLEDILSLLPAKR